MSEEFESKAKALFDESVERLDARTRSQLTQARNRALDEVKRSALQRRWVWAPAGGFAFAVVAALGVMLWPQGARPPGPSALEDLEIVASAEPIDMLADVEFYAWLDEQ